MILKAFFKGFLEGFRTFGHRVTNVVNFILLAFVYFVGIGLTSLLAKLFGKRFLNLGRNKKKLSYWIENRLEKQDLDDYYRQF